VETGDGRTEDSGGLPRNEENVIRLPRDWLGPPEELVPIGSAARARAAQRDLDHGMAPSADAFWSEDSAALHDALQAPSDLSRERLEPPVGLVPPVAGRRSFSLARLPRLRLSGRERRVSRWWGLLALPIAVLLVASVVGLTEGPSSQPAATRASASHGLPAAQLTSTANDGSESAATARFWAQVEQRRQYVARQPQHPASRPRVRAHARKVHPAKTHHPAVVHRSTGSLAPTVTEASASGQTSHSSGSTSTSTVPSAATASTGSSARSKPAAGPPGPSGFGSVSGGCNPKCS
jgi:hypothetical protein